MTRADYYSNDVDAAAFLAEDYDPYDDRPTAAEVAAEEWMAELEEKRARRARERAA